MHAMTTPTRRASWLEIAGIAALLVAAAVFVSRSLGRDSDFQVFHAAATAALRGLDPYDLGNLSTSAGRPLELPFLYPSATLVLFAPFAMLPLPIAEFVWLVLQLGFAAALLVRWRRDFVPRIRFPLFLLVAVFGFNAALLWDLRVRNVALLEQLLLWNAFAAFVADRPARFALLVALAACFKLLPIVFLALLFVPTPRPAGEPRRAPRSALALSGLAMFGAIVGLPVLIGPAWAREFVTRFPAERPYGEINPSALGLIDQLLAPWSMTREGSIVAIALWGIYAIAILVASRERMAGLARSGDRREWVIAAAILFTLVSPRMMIYSYLLMVPAALWLIPRVFTRTSARLVAWSAILFQGLLQLLPGAIDWGWLGYVPYFATLGLWTAWIRTSAPVRAPAAVMIALALVASCGCGGRRSTPTAERYAWVIGRVPPAFDPDGPPDPTRWALERLLTRGLVREDSAGAIVPAAARAVSVSDDSLVYTFRLPGDLAFTDGSPCRSAHFRTGIEGGLARTDHATKSWLLAALRGVDRVRAGRALPPLGIETPDDTTLVLRLARPDPLLLARLAVPGASDAWVSREADGFDTAIGLGPYRVLHADSTRRMVFVRHGSRAPMPPDTIDIRFLAGGARVRSYLRQVEVDLAWPLPPALLTEALPPGYRIASCPARPPRRLLLVMRADLPPTTRPDARHALAHGLNRAAISQQLGERASETGSWIEGAPTFDFPRLDGEEARLRMEEGRLGRSFHVDLAYDADGTGAEVAPLLQGEWARIAIYVDLIPLRGQRWREERASGRAHLLLVESQAPVAASAAELATLVMPLRGPAVGGIRTGWRTRDLDRVLSGSEDPTAEEAAAIQRRLEQDRIVVPLADLPWVRVVRAGAPERACHPHFGPAPGPDR